jgi:NitT/TauT family transport system permease protein
MTNAPAGSLPAIGFRLLGVISLVLIWELLSETYSGLVIAGPVETVQALSRLLGDSTFVMRHLTATLKRVGLALFFGITVGGALGVLAGLKQPVRLMLAPLRWILMSIPGVVVVVVFMLWFGMGTMMVVSITATMLAPVVYVNVLGGMMTVDRNLLEMARVYKLPLTMRLMRIYGMAVASPLLSGIIIASGNGIRMVVLAELLGANEGIGYALSISRANLQTAELYALTLLCMLVIGGMEIGLLRPVRNLIQGKYA